MELSKKASLMQRIKGNLRIITPLIFSSLERIDTIATAMELRRFGKEKKRTWYSYQALKKGDYLTLLLAALFLVASLLLILQNQGRFNFCKYACKKNEKIKSFLLTIRLKVLY